MTNTDGLPTISKRLEEIFGEAADAHDQVKAVFKFLREDGRTYKKAVNLQKAEKMAFLAELQKELEQAHVLLLACEQLRKKLKRHDGTGERRRHVKQRFLPMAFEAFYGMARSTALHTAKVVEALLEKKVKPENFVKEVKKRGLEGIVPSKKPKAKTEPVDKSKPCQKPLPATAEVSIVRGSKGPKEDHDETAFHLTFSAEAQRGCAALPQGEHFILASLVTTDNGGSITATARVEPGSGLWMMLAQYVYMNSLKIAGRLPDELLDKVLLQMPKKRVAA